MSTRPRILVAVEPRVLGESLATMLAAIDLDDVVTAIVDGDLVDAAIVSSDDALAAAPLVILVPGPADHDEGWVHGKGASSPVRLATTTALLAILDERLAAARSREERALALASSGGGGR